MANIDVYLITGFLGSGKTTFLNRLFLQFPKELKLMILMNEFGEIGVDGTLVASDDLDILEISKGSIFCACVKTDFIKGLFEIAHKIKPNILLIESTGVANPADLQKDLSLPIFNDSFKLKEQFCIIDAVHFLDEFGVFASVERQISSSSRFIINKVDLSSREKIEEIKSLIREHHPDPQFYETIYANVDFVELLSLDRLQEKIRAESPAAQMTAEELEGYVEDLLNDPHASLAPPDILMSATFLWQGNDRADITEFTGQLPQGVVRAKGFLRVGQGMVLYNYVMGQYDLEDYDGPVKENRQNVLVFIVPPRVMPQVEESARRYNFVKLGELTPGFTPKK